MDLQYTHVQCKPYRFVYLFDACKELRRKITKRFQRTCTTRLYHLLGSRSVRLRLGIIKHISAIISIVMMIIICQYIIGFAMSNAATAADGLFRLTKIIINDLRISLLQYVRSAFDIDEFYERQSIDVVNAVVGRYREFPNAFRAYTRRRLAAVAVRYIV